jgi:hypothetical protein
MKKKVNIFLRNGVDAKDCLGVRLNSNNLKSTISYKSMEWI